jgi:hypothetical protein
MGVVRQKALDAKIPCGLHIVKPSEKELHARIKDGYQFIAYSIDSVFLNEIAVKPLINSIID